MARRKTSGGGGAGLRVLGGVLFAARLCSGGASDTDAAAAEQARQAQIASAKAFEDARAAVATAAAARTAAIAAAGSQPLEDRLRDLTTALGTEPNEHRVAAICYAQTVARGIDGAHPDHQVSTAFQRALRTAVARELREQRADAEENRALVCSDGDFSSCLCHGSHRGCCSHHGGVAGCERLEPAKVTCGADNEALEAYLVAVGRLSPR